MLLYNHKYNKVEITGLASILILFKCIKLSIKKHEPVTDKPNNEPSYKL